MSEKSRKSRSSNDLELSLEARQLLESLDESVRPVETARQYPRIINYMAAHWKKPLMMDHYFAALVIDQRGKRMGFPLPVVGEIVALQEYYSTTVYPKTSRNVWDKVYG